MYCIFTQLVCLHYCYCVSTVLTVTTLNYNKTNLQFSFWAWYRSVCYWFFLYGSHKLSSHYNYSFCTVLKYLFLLLLLFFYIVSQKCRTHIHQSSCFFCQKLFPRSSKEHIYQDEFYVLLWSQFLLTGYLAVLC